MRETGFRTDLSALFSRVDALAEYAPDFGELLGELLSLLHKVAMLQNLPAENVAESGQENDRLAQLAKTLAADEIQLFYQIGMHARRDMPFAPDPREAFDMALLRMNSFRPQGNLSPVGGQSRSSDSRKLKQADSSEYAQQLAPTTRVDASEEAHNDNAAIDAPTLAVRGEVSAGGSLRAAALAAALGEPAAEKKTLSKSGAPSNSHGGQAPLQVSPQTESSTTPSMAEKQTHDSVSEKILTTPGAPDVVTASAEAVSNKTEASASMAPVQATVPVSAPASIIDKADFNGSDWPQIVEELDISGMPKQLANHMELTSYDGNQLQMKLEASSEHLNTSRFSDRVNSAFNKWVGKQIRLNITVVDAELVTPARLMARVEAEEMAAARKSIDQDPVVRQTNNVRKKHYERRNWQLNEASAENAGRYAARARRNSQHGNRGAEWRRAGKCHNEWPA